MNCGLSNLQTLRDHLLPSTLTSPDEYDTALQRLGLGVAADFDRATRRRLARSSGDSVIFDASTVVYVLPRYPVEELTKLELKEDYGGSWSELTLVDAVQNLDTESGLLIFLAAQGVSGQLLRATWTGGYWFDTSEDNSGTIPAAATALPSDLLYAYLLQCEHVWAQRDKHGSSIGAAPGEGTAVAKLDFVPAVANTLRRYTRHQMQ